MINHLKGNQRVITDFNVGAVGRTLVEAPAIEIDQLYQEMFTGLKEAIPVATYQSFDFTKIQAISAGGVVTTTISPQETDTFIPANSVLSVTGGGTTYLTQFDITIAAGDTTGTLLIRAAIAGLVGNIPANTAFQISPSPAGFVGATNAADFANGADEETADEQKQRFRDYIATLARGTIDACEYGAKTAKIYDGAGNLIERVKSAKLIEPYAADNSEPIGLVNIYIHNGVGSTSDDLMALAQKIIDGYVSDTGTKIPGWKAAGTHHVVSKAPETSLTYTAVLTPKPGFVGSAINALASKALANYITGLDIEASYIHAAAITKIMEIPGVANFVPSTPTADSVPSATHKLMPGTITITNP